VTRRRGKLFRGVSGFELSLLLLASKHQQLPPGSQIFCEIEENSASRFRVLRKKSEQLILNSGIVGYPGKYVLARFYIFCQSPKK
jgi:hypothetical protein